MSSSASSLFDSLPPRPPTPPRETSQAIDDAISFLDDSNEIGRLIGTAQAEEKSAVEDDASPSSSQDTFAISNASKRVGFSPHPVCYKIALPDQSSSPAAQLIKRLPLPKSSKPLKSILKPANIPPPPTPEDLESKFSYFSPEIPGSFAKMLQSVIHQLAGSARASRLDAYLTVNGVLKAYDKVPDAPALLQKMPVLMQFLSRDIAWKNADGNLDTQIINQALTLTMAILYDGRLSEALDDDFRTFLIDRSIAMIEQPDIPKAIVKTHMYLLAHQRFRPSIVTAARADKIVTALQTIDDRCSGNSVIGTRCIIYVRLLDQAPAVMQTRIRDWLEHVFHGMLSDLADVRCRAIETGIRAGLALGRQPHAGAALHEMFETEVEDGQTYYDYLQFRLIKMLSEKELRASVPQIWSAVILFFRSKKHFVETWTHFRSWVQLIQRCLNSGDVNTRYQASLAWNKLVFAVMPSSSTTKIVMSMLSVPVETGLDRRGSDKSSQQSRLHTLECYYNLLHYAFRPGLSNEEHDLAWELHVDRIVPHMTKASGTSRSIACRVLHGLVDGSKGVWNSQAAMEQKPLKPEELPKLDPKWVRSRLRRFLNLLEPVISAGMWSSPEANAALDATWKSLMQSVAAAGSQEVKTSGDLKEALAQLVNVFRRLWTGYSQPPTDVDESRWLKRYVFLIESAATILGSSPFSEDFLSTTKDDFIEVAPTPSHRPSKHHGSPQSPLVILLGQFYKPSSALVIDETYHDSVSKLLRRLISSKPTPAARLDLLTRTFQQCSQLYPQNVDLFTKEQIWLAVAETAMFCLSPEDSAANDQGSQSLGQGIRHALDILLAGIALDASTSCVDEIERLYDALCNAAKAAAGDSGVTMGVTEPLAKSLMNPATLITIETKVRLTNHMLQNPLWPKNQQSLDEARKALWGIGLAPHKSNTFDPFESVYALVVHVMVEDYRSVDGAGVSDLDTSLAVLSSTLAFLGRSPSSLLVTALRKLQDGFAEWIGDCERKTGTPEKLSNLIGNTWSALLCFLNSVPTKDSALLKAFESLLVAGFVSPHRSIVNDTILFWNESFGDQQSLKYPPRLETVLRARVADADISLPTFPDSPEGHVPSTLPQFFESQSQMPSRPALPKIMNSAGYHTSGFASTQPAQSPYFKARKSPASGTSLSSPVQRISRRSASSTPKPRMRHDNSQIEFAPIDSSPIRPTDEFQALTEHQKEVKVRQQENAQLFSDFSSSPLAQSTALPRAKRLNFSSEGGQENENAQLGTPTGLPDGHGIMSDELPSSPTPSASKDAGHQAATLDHEEDVEEIADEPPSSPPRTLEDENEQTAQQSNLGPDDTTVDVTDFVNNESFPTAHEKRQAESSVAGNVAPSDTIESNSDFPSDSQLPTMQLHLEEIAAEAQLKNRASPSTRSSNESTKSSHNNQSGEATRTQNNELNSNAENISTVNTNDETGEMTMVEDSFVHHDPEKAENNLQSPTTSQDGQKASKKRKRSGTAVYKSNKRKQQSPFKSLTSFIFGQSQEEDEDIGEEIVVASSQRSPSIASNIAKESLSPSNQNIQVSESIEPVTASAKDPEPEVMPPPGKRGRGRPRKSETPTPSQTEAGPRKSLKRKASTLSNASERESPLSTGLAKDTSAPRRSKKQSDELVVSSQPSQDAVESGKTTRKAWAVVIDNGGPETRNNNSQDHTEGDHEPENGDSITVATPSKRLDDDQAAAAITRPIATPRSILKRLRDALGDLKGILLGSQEEREIDDVLFELRRETHEAARRGREQ